jgi:outer membrane protein OmpA-like peptidoglycan-associated protein
MKSVLYSFLSVLIVLLLKINVGLSYPFPPTDDKDIQKIEQQADNYYEQKLFKNALVLFSRIYESKPKDAILNYKIGVCYLNTIHKSKAISYLQKVHGLSGGKITFVDLNYYLARAYHYNNEFDKALSNYKGYLSILDPKKKEEAEEISEIKRYMEMCKNGKELIAHPVSVKIQHLNGKINSSFSDFLPVISHDGNTIFFASRRHITTGGKFDPVTDEYYEDIFISNKKNGHWESASPIHKNINNVFHEVPLSISQDGKKLFIYKSDDSNDCDIYYSNMEEQEWSVPLSMGRHINSGDMETGGSISADGQRFYFSSDRERGYGGMDIYYSQLQGDGSWGPAVNLGPEVNTKYNEEAPFLYSDGKTLYFSSEGHNSMGGFDLFTTTYSDRNERWSVPENLGFPINTADDEMSISFTADGKHAYYAANKEDSFGDEDIYLITSHELISSVTPVFNIDNIPKSEQPELKIELEKLSTDFFAVPAPGKILKEKVHFAYNVSNAITEYSKNNINEVIKLLDEFPDMRIQINGYSDSKGSIEYNRTLSEKRAKTVYDYLTSKGVDKNRLVIKGCGNASRHFDHNSSGLKDRRVEFMVIDKEVSKP